MPNRWRLAGLIYKQLERLEVAHREGLLLVLAETSPGLWSLVDLTDDALRSKQEPSNAPKALLDLSDDFPERMSKIVGERLDRLTLDGLMSMPDLDFIVHRWS